jgi:hypothetical protein
VTAAGKDREMMYEITHPFKKSTAQVDYNIMAARTHNEMEGERIMEKEVGNFVKQCNAKEKRE